MILKFTFEVKRVVGGSYGLHGFDLKCVVGPMALNLIENVFPGRSHGFEVHFEVKRVVGGVMGSMALT